MSEDPSQPANQPTSGWRPGPQGSPLSVPLPASQPAGQAESQEDGDAGDAPVISWTASEFIAHHKDVRWYASVIVVTLVLAAIIRLLTRDNISTGMVVIVGIVFCAAAARKPRILNYALSTRGIHIEGRFFQFSDFKSFSIAEEGAFASLELIPFKRFMPLTTIYCSPESEEEAVDFISRYIPYEEYRHSLVDVLASRIRF